MNRGEKELSSGLPPSIVAGCRLPHQLRMDRRTSLQLMQVILILGFSLLLLFSVGLFRASRGVTIESAHSSRFYLLNYSCGTARVKYMANQVTIKCGELYNLECGELILRVGQHVRANVPHPTLPAAVYRMCTISPSMPFYRVYRKRGEIFPCLPLPRIHNMHGISGIRRRGSPPWDVDGGGPLLPPAGPKPLHLHKATKSCCFDCCASLPAEAGATPPPIPPLWR